MKSRKKYKVLRVFLIILVAKIVAGEADEDEDGDLESRSSTSHCTEATKKLKALPGKGWDNLVNADTRFVLRMTYKECETTDDNAFLVPDNVEYSSGTASIVMQVSDVKDTLSDFNSLTAKSINLNANGGYGGFKIEGSFSAEYETTKQKQKQEKSVWANTQGRYELYKASIITTNELVPDFKEKVTKAISVMVNDTKNAYKILQELVKDYGTHVQTKITVGGVIYKEDFLRNEFAKQFGNDYKAIKALAEASFLEIVKIGGSHNTSNNASQLEEYINNSTKSNVRTIGGDTFFPGMTAAEWAKTVNSKPAVIDREGEKLHKVINSVTFPDVPENILDNITRSLEIITEEYYKRNTYPGCMDIESENFEYIANIDTKNCTSTYYKFGGMYQFNNDLGGNVCETDSKLVFINPKTKRMSCPDKFRDAWLGNGISNGCLYTTYWCYYFSNKSDTIDGEVVFGGIYNEKMVNMVTDGESCPPAFEATALINGVKVCWGRGKSGSKYAVPFGGFLTNQHNNNPFTNTTECPKGYIKHEVPIPLVNAYEISFCLYANSNRNVNTRLVQRPPFANWTVGADQ